MGKTHSITTITKTDIILELFSNGKNLFLSSIKLEKMTGANIFNLG